MTGKSGTESEAEMTAITRGHSYWRTERRRAAGKREEGDEEEKEEETRNSRLPSEQQHKYTYCPPQLISVGESGVVLAAGGIQEKEM